MAEDRPTEDERATPPPSFYPGLEIELLGLVADSERWESIC